MHVLQLFVLEAVVLGVLASGLIGMPALIGTAVLGVLVLSVTFLRSQGRWWLERQVMARQHRRRGLTGAPVTADARLGILHRLTPSLSAENVAMSDGSVIGVARDDAGWFAVAAVVPPESGAGPAPGLPLDLLAAALSEAGQQGAVLQVVTSTVPSNSAEAAHATVAKESYRRLLAGLDSPVVPAERTTWVTVRLDARALAEALSDYAVDLSLAPSVVAALARRVGKSLRRVGVVHRLLDAEALVAALAQSCGFTPETHAGAEQVREEWSAWHYGQLAHRCYWIRQWPPVDRAAAMFGWLDTIPTSMVTVSLTLTANGADEDFGLRGLVRLTGPAQALAQLSGAVADGVGKAGGELFPLDGEHGPAVYASAPTGGGAG
ncbi:type VII secretion protein EccE [Micromonospora musae]|uniref:Type VII secretion protein EccE n=1 Tax=Micromonospora musae TaxID=1894970 RepID=A0A3A9Y609_9ACTN|nr:type VII secretion protein EccE [Micromonospora musae]RKN17936.1 type VII secretion protein EccE [Micromonospora musae]RKN32921.1 type VII secretion protein EccE [Micromonospora musae]